MTHFTPCDALPRPAPCLTASASAATFPAALQVACHAPPSLLLGSFARPMQCIAILMAAFAALLRAEDLPKNFDPDVSHWLVIEPPLRSNHDEFQGFMNRATMRSIEWSVAAEGNRVKAALSEGVVAKPPGDRPAFSLNLRNGEAHTEPTAVHQVSDGWLASYNRGEFGGVVWWFSADGKNRRAITTDRVNQFITHQGRVLAVEGLAHMGSSEGSVLEFRRKEH